MRGRDPLAVNGHNDVVGLVLNRNMSTTWTAIDCKLVVERKTGVWAKTAVAKNTAK